LTSGIKAPVLSSTEVREKAEEFRKLYVKPTNLVPVPIVEIVEFDLGLTVRLLQGLLTKLDMDGYITLDLSEIHIDHQIYWDERYNNRCRFTFAHEAGHYFLHGDYIKAQEFKNAEDWIEFRMQLNEEEHNWFEWQAYEFAGRLLVPRQELKSELENLRPLILQAKQSTPHVDDQLLIEYVSSKVCKKFEVSEGVITRRIYKEGLWSDLEFDKI